MYAVLGCIYLACVMYLRRGCRFGRTGPWHCVCMYVNEFVFCQLLFEIVFRDDYSYGDNARRP